MINNLSFGARSYDSLDDLFHGNRGNLLDGVGDAGPNSALGMVRDWILDNALRMVRDWIWAVHGTVCVG